jgi:hypothetical protein
MAIVGKETIRLLSNCASMWEGHRRGSGPVSDRIAPPPTGAARG